MVKGIVNALVNANSGGDSSGDKIFVTNNTGVKFNTGDKVLVNFANNDGADYGNTFTQGNSWNQSWVLKDGMIKLSNQSGNKGHNIVHTPNGFSETSYPQSVWRIPSYPFEYRGDFFLGQCSNNKLTMLNYRTGEATPYDDYPLTDEILLDWDKGILYNNDKTLSYDTGAGNLTNTQKFFQAYGNTIVYSFTNEVTFIDVTDFPNCTKTVYKLPMTFEQNKGVTGTSFGDYYIGAYKNAYYLLRFNGSGYEYDKMIVTKSNTTGFIDMEEKLFGFVETDGTPVAYCLEDGFIKKLDIPIDVLNTIKADTSLDTYNRQGVSFNKDLSVISWDWSTGNYLNYSRYCHVKDGVAVYIAKPEQKYFGIETSFTGFATGNVDDLGRTEVKILSADKVDLTIITNIDVEDNEIIFEGIV